MRNLKTNYTKVFSVGLTLNDEEEDIYRFINQYAQILNSVYFSLPLGKPFYSRRKLTEEYDALGSNEKLLRIAGYLKEKGIRREVAINHNGLSLLELDKAIYYLKENLPDVEEIVCLAPFAKQLRDAFPNVELKYSFNNMSVKTAPVFDTYVVGKNYLRDMAARHRLIDQGYQLVLLLNNGCSFNCQATHCNKIDCEKTFRHNMERHTVNELYALQSFFPSELQKLLDIDPYGKMYRFKVSNRPSSISFTSKILDGYTGKVDEKDLLKDKRSLCLFSGLGVLMDHYSELELQKIYEHKKRLSL